MARVPRLKLGSQGLEVSAQGLGCMGMSAFYGPPKPDPDMIHLIHHAVNAGVTFLDTSDMYGPKTNEILLGKALKGELREKVELATKFGIKYDGNAREVCGDPAYVRAACEASLQRLEVDCIDLYYQHRIDTRLPIEITNLQGKPFRNKNLKIVVANPRSFDRNKKPTANSDNAESSNKVQGDDGSTPRSGRSARDAVTPLAHVFYKDQLEQKKKFIMQTLKKLACPAPFNV